VSQIVSAYPKRVVEDFTTGTTRNRPFMIRRADVEAFSAVTGDHHPLHCDASFAATKNYPDILVHGMLIASRCAGFVAYEFVGSHGLLVSLSSDFRQAAYCDEQFVWSARVERVDSAAGTVQVSWVVNNARQAIVQRGSACAWFANP
jgi:3-hydroxybutyryl-CoA dehydratase